MVGNQGSDAGPGGTVGNAILSELVRQNSCVECKTDKLEYLNVLFHKGLANRQSKQANKLEPADSESCQYSKH